MRQTVAGKLACIATALRRYTETRQYQTYTQNEEPEMKRQKIGLTLIALLAALAAGVSIFAAESIEQKSASASDYAKPSVDLSGIEAPKDAPAEKYSFSLQAAGTQTYTCQLKDGKPVWAGRPDADLYENGVKVGRHSGTPAGPFWETLDGSSRVTGTPDAAKRKAKAAPGNSVDTIDWLWVPAVQQSGDKFGKVISIQRVSTVGGSKKFSGACDLTKDAKPVSVFYSATYYFNIAR